MSLLERRGNRFSLGLCWVDLVIASSRDCFNDTSAIQVWMLRGEGFTDFGRVRSGRRTLALELACESERIEAQNARRRVMLVVRQRVRKFISQRRSPVAHKPEIKNYENQRRGIQIRI
jgi:hypothetical protein